MTRLKDKIAIVLGAGKRDNIGQAIARRFAAEGAKVVVSGRDAPELERLADDIGGTSILCDITRRADIDNLVNETKTKFGRIDVAVNAAGWARTAPFPDVAEEDLVRTMEIQFKGPFQFMQALVKAMDKGGSIIQISSVTATIMTNDYAPYMGTKAGIDHVVRAIANEFGHKGIRANSISPGLTESPMTEAVFKMPGLIDAFVAGYPLGRIGTPDDIAAAAVWLASDECFMTGQNLQVNGGLTLRSNPSPEERKAAMARAAARQA